VHGRCTRIRGRSHMNAGQGIDVSVPPSGAGCVDCETNGGWWLHLRRCAQCGHIGCCDNSPSRHASAHARSTGHPVIRTFEPDEDWFYDYPQLDVFRRTGPGTAGPSPARPKRPRPRLPGSAGLAPPPVLTCNRGGSARDVSIPRDGRAPRGRPPRACPGSKASRTPALKPRGAAAKAGLRVAAEVGPPTGVRKAPAGWC
jgi:hypothetical protein